MCLPAGFLQLQGSCLYNTLCHMTVQEADLQQSYPQEKNPFVLKGIFLQKAVF